MSNIILLMCSLNAAFAAMLGKYPLPDDSIIGLASIATDRHLAFFAGDHLSNALQKNRFPQRIEIEIRAGNDGAGKIKGKTLTTDVFSQIVFHIVAPNFIDFYESHKQWLYDNVNKNAEKWPSILNFGRAIRNSMSHGNKIWFDRPAATPVSWGGLRYGPTDNGLPVVLHDLSVADVIILMFEMSDELDKLHCPIF